VDSNTDDLAAFLDRAWNNAKDGANALPEQLSIEQQAALNFIAPIGSVISVSKNSTSQSSGGYNPGNLTLRQVVGIWTKLIELYDEVKARIVSAAACDSVVLPDGFDFDGPVYQVMKSTLKVSGRVATSPDLRDLRVPLSRTETLEFNVVGYIP
jgi:hypothetical protein